MRTQEFFLAGANPSPEVFHEVWRILGDGVGEEEIEDRFRGTASDQMAAATAARVLRRAAEAEGLPLGGGVPPVDFAARARKARRDRERLETMVRYAFSRTCRTRFIFDYFAGGGSAGQVPRCGTCDVCLGWSRGSVRPLDDAEYERVRIALSAVARLHGRFGIERVAQVLVGSKSKDVVERGLHRIPTYGRLSAISLDDAKDLLAALAESVSSRDRIEGEGRRLRPALTREDRP